MEKWFTDVVKEPNYTKEIFKSINKPDDDSLTGEGVIISLMDTGVDYSHRDLQDIEKGYNSLKQSREVEDESGHGTAIAGIIKQIAPKAKIIMNKCLDKDGNGTVQSALSGVLLSEGSDILCISLGTEYELSPMFTEYVNAMINKGVTVVSACGNNDRLGLDYPARLDRVFAVGGMDSAMSKSSFSNRGEELDFIALAEDIPTTFVNDSYAKVTGTSFASPIVTGAIALLLSKAKAEGIKLHPHQIYKILADGASNNGYHNLWTGYGYIDLEKSLQSLDKYKN